MNLAISILSLLGVLCSIAMLCFSFIKHSKSALRNTRIAQDQKETSDTAVKQTGANTTTPEQIVWACELPMQVSFATSRKTAINPILNPQYSSLVVDLQSSLMNYDEQIRNLQSQIALLNNQNLAVNAYLKIHDVVISDPKLSSTQEPAEPTQNIIPFPQDFTAEKRFAPIA